MIEHTLGCIPLPTCPHSLIPKDPSSARTPQGELFISRQRYSSVVSDIHGPGLQRLMLSKSSSSICSYLAPHLWIAGVLLIVIRFYSKRESKRKENL
jgi:hypothetical protein